ncbi:MAG TPA: allantoicase [Thermoanaerobaculia bacterium]|nr:allantoicase [Thermoanaerobaculia bacterium]
MPSHDSFTDLIDLAAERLGGTVLHATDDFFAPKENLIRSSPPEWREHEYTDRGKWMDGWESRRKRTPGHDAAIVRLGLSGIVRGVVVDTSFFRGNFPESCSIEACSVPPETPLERLLSPDTEWIAILPRSPLKGDHANAFAIEFPYTVSHVRLNIVPDGGVARLRVHGEVVPEWRREGGLGRELDLAAIEHGGEVLDCSDMFFGPKHNLILPGRGRDMSDGWETRRRRGPGHDWVVLRLGVEAAVRRIEIDTAHFRGNYPDTASVDGCRAPSDEALARAEWSEILPRTKLEAHTRHLFLDAIAAAGPFTHVRLNVHPDGGVSRLRVWGTATEETKRAEVARRLDRLVRTRAAAELAMCCGSRAWVDGMLAARPFGGCDALVAASDRIWQGLGPEERLEAFRAHPRIGERKGGAAAARRWSEREQAAAAGAAEALAKANRAYEEKFGHIYIVCATGKSGDEILADLQSRMKNAPGDELRVAAEEQRKITRLRLEKLVDG